jgi:hypothetical protein
MERWFRTRNEADDELRKGDICDDNQTCEGPEEFRVKKQSRREIDDRGDGNGRKSESRRARTAASGVGSTWAPQLDEAQYTDVVGVRVIERSRRRLATSASRHVAIRRCCLSSHHAHR